MARLQLHDDDVRPVRGPVTGARTIDIAALYATHSPDIRRLCLRLTRDPSVAEDLAQETFTRFIARLPHLPSTVNIGAYLQVTARNLYLKSLRAGTMEVCDELLEERLGSDDDLERDPARATLLVEQIHQMRRSTSRLNGRQRRALMLREVEGRSYTEIADSMGISPDAVAHVLARARARLRSEYRREQGPPAIPEPACSAARDQLSSYLDGQLADAAHDSVAAHLAGCRECRNVLTSYREASIQLRAAGPGSALAAMLERAGGILQGAVGNATGTAATIAGSAAIVVAGGSGVVVAHHLTAPGSQEPAAAAAGSPPAGSTAAAAVSLAGSSSTVVDTWRPGSSGPTSATVGVPGPQTDPGDAPTTSDPGPTTTRPGETTGQTDATPVDDLPVDPPVAVPTVPKATPPVTTPTVTVPAVTTPPVTTPHIATPAVTTPIATVPSVELPRVTVPSITTPAVPLPTVTIPPIKLPKLPGK